MAVKGFNLELQEFCDFCKYFKPEVEQIDYTFCGEAPGCINYIRCANKEICSKLAENLKDRINGKSKA